MGTVKETIQQVSMSKKWDSKPALDESGEPVLSTKGKPVLKKSYSVLQDDFFRYMRDAGYDDVERGVRTGRCPACSCLKISIFPKSRAGENTRKISLLRNRGAESLHENRADQAGKNNRYMV